MSHDKKKRRLDRDAEVAQLSHDNELHDWQQQEEDADRMVMLIGSMYRDNNSVVEVFGRRLVKMSSAKVIEEHGFVSEHFGKKLTTRDTFPVLDALHQLGEHSMRYDIGKATLLCQQNNACGSTEKLVTYLRPLIASTQKTSHHDEFFKKDISSPRQVLARRPQDIVLYGFGRIGRLLARMLVEKTGSGCKMLLRAIVVRQKLDPKLDLQKRASLLMSDSVHGSFPGTCTITVDESSQALVVNGNKINVIYAARPGEVNFESYGIRNAIVIDNTGIWRDRDGLSKHLASPGVAKVLLTAPAKDANIPTVVAGVEPVIVPGKEEASWVDENIVCAASCTTNAIAPVLQVVEKEYGLVKGHIETVHSFTNDQNLADNFHTKKRRGRSAVLNMVITETGAGTAVGKCLPQLAGKLTANAIRVPTPDVSLAILVLTLEREVTVEEVNQFLLAASLEGPLKDQIDYVANGDAASSDMVGSRSACIVDSCATITQGSQLNLYCWYDNEFGYSCQVIRVAQKLAGVHFTRFPS